jgi:O-antigen ligase
VKVLERYWWPTIVLIYPLANIFFLIPAIHLLGLNSARNILTVTALIGGALFEWVAHPELSFSDIRHLPRALWKHPVLLAGFALAVWVIVSSFLSDDPAVALTGALSDGSDSAISYVALVGLMTFSYLYYQRNPRDIPILYDFVVASGIIVAVLALFEVFTQRSIMFPGSIKASDLPLVTFEGHGHLAGYLALVFGGVVTMWFRRNWQVLPVMVLLVIAMSVSFNRASMVAALIVTLLGWRTPKLVVVAMSVVIGGYFVGQKIIQVQQTGQTRAISDGTSSETRKYLWKAGLAGIASRPITGYGGALFSREWYKKLTFKELKTYLKLELGWDLIVVLDKSKITPLYDTVQSNGNRTLATLNVVKIHSQAFDVALMWGIIGLFLYLILFYYGINGFIGLRFSTTCLITYSVFLLTWYSSDQSNGAFFILVAVNLAKFSNLHLENAQNLVKKYQRNI